MHETSSSPFAQFDLILGWTTWKWLWATWNYNEMLKQPICERIGHGWRFHALECYNTQLFIIFKWEQILQTRSHIMMKSQHNSVLHAFSVPDWSEMCRVVGVLTVLLLVLLPTQYTAREIVKMWCQEFDKYLLANIYIDIDITLLISDMDFLYQFNLRLHQFWRGFFQCKKKKKKFKSWQVCD